MFRLRRQLDELQERIRLKMPKRDAKPETAATSSPSKYRLPIVIGKVKGVFQIIRIKLTIKVREKTMQVELLDDEDGMAKTRDGPPEPSSNLWTML